MKFLWLAALFGLAFPGVGSELRATGDLGVVIERADGRVLIVEHTNDSRVAQIEGLGDLSHASVDRKSVV